MDYVAQNGLSDVSLRTLATALGTSHRMLIHHFGSKEELWVEIEVVAAERPQTIVEQNVGAGGKRIANGTYILEELPQGGTRIVFEYAWQQAPLSERIAAPLVRAYLTRENNRAMARLAEQLASRFAAVRSAA